MRASAQKPKTKSSRAKNSAKGKVHTNNSSAQIEQLVLEHRDNGRKLARSLLRRWRVRMNLEEVDSIVDLALCEAAKRFSSEHGASFMTFFFYHLRGCLVRAVSQAVNANNIVLASSQWHGMDIAETTAVGEDAFRSYIPDCPSFGHHDVASPEANLLRKEEIKVCRKACAQLDELEQEVLIRSFENEEPLVDIAKSLGYSRCHISRVKKRALENLEAILGGAKEEEEKAQALQGSGSLKIRVTKSRTSSNKRRRRRSLQTRTAGLGESKRWSTA